MAASAPRSSSALFLTNAMTASAAPGSAAGLAASPIGGTPSGAPTAATVCPGLICSFAVRSMRQANQQRRAGRHGSRRIGRR